MYKNWIHDDQLLILVELLAQFCGYDFGENDGDAVFYGIKETEYEDKKWFEYPIAGRITAGFRLSKDLGTDVVHFEVQSTEGIEAKVDTAMTVLNYIRTRRSSQPTAPGYSRSARNPES